MSTERRRGPRQHTPGKRHPGSARRRSRRAARGRRRRLSERVDAQRQRAPREADAIAERARPGLAISGSPHGTTSAPATTVLTPQELHVAVAVAHGAANKEAAAALFLSVKTVEFHLSRVYRKLGLSSRAQLARLMTLDECTTSLEVSGR